MQISIARILAILQQYFDFAKAAERLVQNLVRNCDDTILSECLREEFLANVRIKKPCLI